MEIIPPAILRESVCNRFQIGIPFLEFAKTRRLLALESGVRIAYRGQGLHPQFRGSNFPFRGIGILKRVFRTAGTGREDHLKQDDIQRIKQCLMRFVKLTIGDMHHAMGRDDGSWWIFAFEATNRKLQYSTP